MKNKIINLSIILAFLSIIVYGLTAHSCRWDNCPYKGVVFYSPSVSEYEEGTDAYYIDQEHFNHPEMDYNQLESIVFKSVSNN